jgi:hypothetical protein
MYHEPHINYLQSGMILVICLTVNDVGFELKQNWVVFRIINSFFIILYDRNVNRAQSSMRPSPRRAEGASQGRSVLGGWNDCRAGPPAGDTRGDGRRGTGRAGDRAEPSADRHRGLDARCLTRACCCRGPKRSPLGHNRKKEWPEPANQKKFRNRCRTPSTRSWR